MVVQLRPDELPLISGVSADAIRSLESLFPWLETATVDLEILHKVLAQPIETIGWDGHTERPTLTVEFIENRAWRKKWPARNQALHFKQRELEKLIFISAHRVVSEPSTFQDYFKHKI